MKFTKDTLIADGEYVFYAARGYDTPHEQRKFVARFKRGGKGDFLSFLKKNFTVEEFFSMVDKGMAPLDILETKGYVMAHIRKWLKEAGLPQTKAGFEMMLENERKARVAKGLSC